MIRHFRQLPLLLQWALANQMLLIVGLVVKNFWVGGWGLFGIALVSYIGLLVQMNKECKRREQDRANRLDKSDRRSGDDGV